MKFRSGVGLASHFVEQDAPDRTLVRKVPVEREVSERVVHLPAREQRLQVGDVYQRAVRSACPTTARCNEVFSPVKPGKMTCQRLVGKNSVAECTSSREASPGGAVAEYRSDEAGQTLTLRAGQPLV